MNTSNTISSSSEDTAVISFIRHEINNQLMSMMALTHLHRKHIATVDPAQVSSYKSLLEKMHSLQVMLADTLRLLEAVTTNLQTGEKASVDQIVLQYLSNASSEDRWNIERCDHSPVHCSSELLAYSIATLMRFVEWMCSSSSQQLQLSLTSDEVVVTLGISGSVDAERLMEEKNIFAVRPFSQSDLSQQFGWGAEMWISKMVIERSGGSVRARWTSAGDIVIEMLFPALSVGSFVE